jgi:cation transport ATPase
MSITDTIVVNGIDPIIEDAKIVEISSMEKFTPEDVKAAIASYTGLENDITLKAARDFSAGIAKKEGYSLEKMAEASKKFQVPSGVHDKVKSFESDGKSVMFAMKGKELMGLVIFDLFVPERMSVALERLGKSGIKEIILLSAESTALSEAIAKKAGISTVRSRADDREKIDAIEKMVAEGKHVTVVSKGHDMSKFAGNSGAVSIDVPAYGFEGIEDARCSSFMEVPSLLSMAKGSVKRASQSMNFGFYFNTFAIIMASLGAVDAELAILMVMASVVLVATYSALPYISWKR